MTTQKHTVRSWESFLGEAQQARDDALAAPWSRQEPFRLPAHPTRRTANQYTDQKANERRLLASVLRSRHA